MNRHIALAGLLAVVISGTAAAARPANSVSQSIRDGATFSGSIAWTATPTPSRGVSSIHFFIDGVDKWEDSRSPYQFNGDPSGQLDTTTLSNGTHIFKVVAAWSWRGATATNTVTATVNNAAPPPPPPPPPPAQCADGIDNDGDGLIDSADPGCSGPTDNDETNAPPPPPPADNQPVAAFTYTPANSVTGSPTNFDASSSTCADTPCSYSWEDDGPDGPGGTQWPLGTAKQLSFTFQTAGTKYVRLNITDVDGDTATTMSPVSVSSPPAPPPPPPPAPSGGTVTRANLFVSSSGSDTGINCVRSATPAAFPSRTTVCATLNKAYALSSCGDTILVGGGTFSQVSVNYQAAKDSCTSASRISAYVPSGESVTVSGSTAGLGARHLLISGKQGTWTTNSIEAFTQGGYPCSSGAPSSADLVFDSMDLHWVKFLCANALTTGVSATIQNSDIGPLDSCATANVEDLVQLRDTRDVLFKNNYLHDLTQPSGCGTHADCVQLQGNDVNTVFDGNVFARCYHDGIFAKADFHGPIDGLTAQNNSFGAGAGGLTGWAFSTGCGSGGVRNVIVRNNSFAGGFLGTGGCGTIPNCRETSNLFGSGMYTNNSGGCTLDYNAYANAQGSLPGGATPGLHPTYSAVPNWVNPSGNRPDLHIGSNSSGIIDTGSSSSSDYASLDADGVARPLGKAADVGAYEKG